MPLCVWQTKKKSQRLVHFINFILTKKGNYALYLDSEKLVESENGAGPYQYIVAQKKLPNADTKTEQKKLLKEWIGEAQDAEKL